MYKWKKLMKSGAIVSSDSSTSSTSSTSSIGSASSCSSQPSSPLCAPTSTPLTSMSTVTSVNRKISVDIQGNEQDSFSNSPIDVSVRTPSTEIVIPASMNVVINKRKREEKEKTKDKVKKRRKTKPNVLTDASPPPSFEIVGNANVSLKRILAMEDDNKNVNALHCFVRQNIEVFTASIEDINIPAPGRKSRIHLGQVGVRCIHCKKLPSKERVKRAVCYPSSVNRVYHSVSDMKFDHFTACKSFPTHLRDQFLQLKNTHKRRSSQTQLLPSSTAQYYCESARAIGMVDYRGGIFLKSYEDFTRMVSKNTRISNPSLPITQEFKKPHLLKKQPRNTVARFLWDNHASLPVKPKCISINFTNETNFHGHRLHPQHQNMKNTLNNRNQQIQLYSIDHKGKSCATAQDKMHSNAFDQSFRSPNVLENSNKEMSVSLTVREKQQSSGRMPTVPYRYFNTDTERLMSTNYVLSCRKSHNERNGRYTLPILPTHDTNTKIIPYNRNTNGTAHPNKNSRSNTIRRLGLHDDNVVLNPLHCFVRNNIELFTATEDDISAPSPGRKQKVVIGQVGIRCIHCADFVIKDRVKRSVCYPPSVYGIYHCVSNMKFDHFSACRGMPKDLQEEFWALKKSCSRKGSGGTNGTNFTAHYYQTSALKIGLYDSESGIRWKIPKTDNLDKISRPSSHNQEQWNMPDPGVKTCKTNYTVPPSNKSAHFRPSIPPVSTPHPHMQYQTIPVMKNKKCNDKNLSKIDTPQATIISSNNRNGSLATLFKPQSHNDGLFALVIAAAEHSHREESKNDLYNTSFSSLSSSKLFASINVQR